MKYLIVFLGVLGTVFYGGFARQIFVYPETCKPKPEFRKSWHVHQIWLNGIGSAIGWISVYYLLFVRSDKLKELGYAEWQDAVLGLVAILGITGLLPYLLSKLTSLKG